MIARAVRSSETGTRIKAVKNKIAPPFLEEAEFDISGLVRLREADILELAASSGVIQRRAGPSFTYDCCEDWTGKAR